MFKLSDGSCVKCLKINGKILTSFVKRDLLYLSVHLNDNDDDNAYNSDNCSDIEEYSTV
jgi:hypothetical protein